MCDYSLHFVASRPAKVGERLVSTGFATSVTRGFASVEDLNTAVCILPGTELAFEQEVESDFGVAFRSRRKFGHKLARFRQVNREEPNVHHDALEFPDGQIVLLTELSEGQYATVLQLPAEGPVEAEKRRELEPFSV
jgi:hypothetical protein